MERMIPTASRHMMIVHVEDGRTRAWVAHAFGCTASAVTKIVNRARETGQIGPCRLGRPPGTGKVEPHQEWLADLIERRPDLTAGEAAALMKEELGVSASRSTISRALKSMRLTRKKKTLRASELNKPEVQRKIEHHKMDVLPYLCASLASGRQLVAVDETSAATNMTRRYVWAPVGSRLHYEMPAKRAERQTLMAAMGSDGLWTAGTVEDGMKAYEFELFAEEFLAPLLKRDAIVLMDNLRAHHSQEVEEIIEKRGAEIIFIPPYSPWYNPIELAFSKIKRYLEKIGARTLDALFDALGKLRSLFTIGEFLNYFREAGIKAA